jgi:hypothetical protein
MVKSSAPRRSPLIESIFAISQELLTIEVTEKVDMYDPKVTDFCPQPQK